MAPPAPQWQLLPLPDVPAEFLQRVRAYVPDSAGDRAAQLLWQRGIRADLAGFLDPNHYKPTGPFAFGSEMERAVERLQQAMDGGERVAIWGDFDADGVTATSVLWEGLGEFLPPEVQLSYVIPNRLTDSHGLNLKGIEALAAEGVRLIVTCDTGSTNAAEIDRAAELGIDTIVTDHHTLPAARPNVVALLNPRSFPPEHPLAQLSGVAVAYKLVEALYERLPEMPQNPLDRLLDLVAIGAIADLVELKGDCRYLVQRGLGRLRTQSAPATATRPGIFKLLELCQRTGDRPTDISFGLGPRINAISRIHGDATVAVELLTGTDPERCHQLALETELTNARRKGLQNELANAVKDEIAGIDLSTAGAIVLADPQWPGGVLGLVAGQIAREYGRPTILLVEDPAAGLARGSARSVNGIDLYELVASQSHLLHRFGGHPFAAGLSLPLENVPLFRAAIDRQLRQQADGELGPTLVADLAVAARELGRALFQELKLLEPYGMGNPTPRLLVENCWFETVRQRNISDRRGDRVRYIKTTFLLCDETRPDGARGHWWGHYSSELPQAERSDAVVELDYNPYAREYEARLVAVRPRGGAVASAPVSQLLDWRGPDRAAAADPKAAVLKLKDVPQSWGYLQQAYARARSRQQPLALAYALPADASPEDIWCDLVGIAKYLSRTQQSAPRTDLRARLGIDDSVLELGLAALKAVGFVPIAEPDSVWVTGSPQTDSAATAAIEAFLAAVAEEQFQRRYFCEAPLATLHAVVETLEGPLEPRD